MDVTIPAEVTDGDTFAPVVVKQCNPGWSIFVSQMDDWPAAAGTIDHTLHLSLSQACALIPLLIEATKTGR